MVIHLLHDLLCFPDTMKELMVIALSVDQGILHFRISYPHEVVEIYQGPHELFHIVWSLVHCGQETSEVIGQDSECIFDNAPCPRQTIVEDSYIVCHVAAGIRFHQLLPLRESVVTNLEVVVGCVVTGKWCGK